MSYLLTHITVHVKCASSVSARTQNRRGESVCTTNYPRFEVWALRLLCTITSSIYPSICSHRVVHTVEGLVNIVIVVWYDSDSNILIHCPSANKLFYEMRSKRVSLNIDIWQGGRYSDSRKGPTQIFPMFLDIMKSPTLLFVTSAVIILTTCLWWGCVFVGLWLTIVNLD